MHSTKCGVRPVGYGVSAACILANGMHWPSDWGWVGFVVLGVWCKGRGEGEPRTVEYGRFLEL
jgi:hypothetical protein